MKLRTLLTTVVLGLTLTTVSYANDINLSWSMRALQGQALTQTIKQSKLQKYSKIKHIQTKKRRPKNSQTYLQNSSSENHTNP